MANRAKLQLLTCVALSLIQSVLTISADSLSPSRISFHRPVTVNGHERGESSGHTIFSYQDYSKAGNYEARYFRGDSAAGNGLVCRGLPSLLYTSHSGAAVECVLEASSHSGVISVQ